MSKELEPVATENHIESLESNGFWSPRKLEFAMNKAYKPAKYKVFHRGIWYMKKEEADAVTSTLIGLKETHPTYWDDTDLGQFSNLYRKQLSNVGFVKLEIDYGWFNRRNLMKELNGFQIFVGKVVGIF